MGGRNSSSSLQSTNDDGQREEFTVIKEKVVHQGKFSLVFKRRLELPDGKKANYEIVGKVGTDESEGR